MYLPTLPAMGRWFDTSIANVQLGLATCIVGLAVGQLIFGPLSDKYGRKTVLLASLILFIGATVISLFSTSIEMFNTCRFFQGLGGAGGVVLSRAVATDCYTGNDLAKALAIIGAINGVAPVVAPVIGGMFAESIGWKGIFTVLAIVGAVLVAMTMILKESLDIPDRHKGSLRTLFLKAKVLFHNRPYLRWTLVFGMANAILFSYISTSSFIIQQQYGLSELRFSLLFAVNAAGIVLGSICALKFHQLRNASRIGCAGALAMGLLQFASLYLDLGLWGYEILSFCTLFCVGLIFPSATTLAMNHGRDAIGWAAAIVGAFGFLCGGIVTPLVGLGDISVSTFTSITICAAIGLTASLLHSPQK
ncbi:MAG: multidrug effflux MFS transporter, partial [Muribaculaceae bacterium]|nr:multidrug effflux MFS transporter [Muribaculaceae bacterium]